MKNNAFSLVEIIIVIVIILIFSGIGLASYNQYNQTKELEATAQKLADILELAKKKAISGGQSCPDILVGFQVSFTPPTDYQLSEKCSALNTLGNYKVNPYYSITSSQNPIVFARLTGWLINYTDTNIKIKNNQTNRCIDININKFGQIEIGNIYSTGC